MFGANCFLGLGYLFKVPIIAISSTIEYPWINDIIGNTGNLAYVPNTIMMDFDKTKFRDRLKNVFHHYYSVYKFYSDTDYIQTSLMRKYLSPEIPNIREIERSIALTIVNKNPLIHGVQPVSPSIIEVSAMHIMNENQLKLSLVL